MPVGTSVAVQQSLMRRAVAMRTTMNIYRDAVTDEMVLATSKVAGARLELGQLTDWGL
jgi:hypothetical protein